MSMKKAMTVTDHRLEVYRRFLSDVEPEDYDVAVMHDVFLAFGSYEALFLGSVI